jgi:pimeloyl-ACP methyl ester carboxylesterase
MGMATELRAALLRLLGLALLAASLALAWSQAPERPVQTLVERWSLPGSRFVEIEGGVAHLCDEGPTSDPQPLLLLHGLGGSLHDWAGWAEALHRTQRVIRIDLPGNGLSDGPADGDYASARQARWVLKVLDQMGVREVRAVGHGLGGDVAAQLALQAPTRVRRLMLVAAARPSADALPPALRLASRVPWPQWAVSWLLPRALVADTLRAFYADPAQVTPAQVDRRQELLQRSGNRWALLQQWRQLPPEEDRQAAFAQLKLPVLLLWGTADRLLPPAQALALQARIPGSRLQMLDGVGHLPQEEAPAASLALVLPFIEGTGR